MLKYKFLFMFVLVFSVGCGPPKCDTRYKVSYYNTSGQFVKSELVLLPENVKISTKYRQGNMTVAKGMCDYIVAPMGWMLEIEEVK